MIFPNVDQLKELKSFQFQFIFVLKQKTLNYQSTTDELLTFFILLWTNVILCFLTKEAKIVWCYHQHHVLSLWFQRVLELIPKINHVVSWKTTTDSTSLHSNTRWLWNKVGQNLRVYIELILLAKLIDWCTFCITTRIS